MKESHFWPLLWGMRIYPEDKPRDKSNVTCYKCQEKGTIKLKKGYEVGEGKKVFSSLRKVEEGLPVPEIAPEYIFQS